MNDEELKFIDTIAQVSGSVDPNGNLAVVAVTQSGQVLVHYRGMKEWIKLPEFKEELD